MKDAIVVGTPLSETMTTTQQTRFESLDSLRGIAAVAVMLGHIGPLTHSAYYLAVDFFLVLSGFILSHSYFNTAKLSVSQFCWVRFARMYPLHLLTLLITIVVFQLDQRQLSFRDIGLHFFFIQNMGLGPEVLSLNNPSWTISVEFWINCGVYVVLAALGFKFSRRFVATIAVIGVLSFIVLTVFTGSLNTNTYDYKGFLNSGLVRCLASFSMGVFAFAYRHQTRGLLAHSAVQFMLLFAFLTFLLMPVRSSPADFAAPVLFAAIVCSFSFEEGIAARALASAKYLGAISFAIYLIHFPVRIFFEMVTGFDRDAYTIAGVASIIACTIVLSTLAHHYFELPVYRLLRRQRFLSKNARTSHTSDAHG